ncbi:MAG: hypothetical protein HY805_03475 [Nitrospirae bacterium]|nr:hypothetical protein [Nitrospirota bacterium]
MDLKAKAEETFVSKGTSKDGKTIYRVLSSESYSKKSALSKAQAIMDTKKIQAVVFFATE